MDALEKYVKKFRKMTPKRREKFKSFLSLLIYVANEPDAGVWLTEFKEMLERIEKSEALGK